MFYRREARDVTRLAIDERSNGDDAFVGESPTAFLGYTALATVTENPSDI